MEDLKEKISSKTDIFCKWKWGDIYESINKKVKEENYGKNVWDVAIKELINITSSWHLLEEDKEEKTGKFYIVVESSRGTSLYKKLIPNKIMPLFKDLIPLTDIEGVYRSYKLYKYIY